MFIRVSVIVFMAWSLVNSCKYGLLQNHKSAKECIGEWGEQEQRHPRTNSGGVGKFGSLSRHHGHPHMEALAYTPVLCCLEENIEIYLSIML
ncbi:hypothetical protein LZ32DRAFT_158024 [Colletotrichum eremochloae]|nr:hypothetical protein LZ32DRAFT_158024 [Colletotrichum eremochloae]